MDHWQNDRLPLQPGMAADQTKPDRNERQRDA
ncbi:hypothetical protein SIAM614_26086 [Stappia aggregata IAM 12614]|uniref:Uncharacterized protein n=1 Tax=Roseibium aggregatum (strain ATCC 25650 / DSM 13394 / JCM 20685 / NBRC 16684 / NCIMB 2208 / IAM 12614 / B1) TaxID=384765 RepID=A0NZV3_ROSAI|nr:hypothetical protein SIAM614_26086 [Stappia aggregata IAM 12614] [Roseibium aggregatum IAM 12614]